MREEFHLCPFLSGKELVLHSILLYIFFPSWRSFRKTSWMGPVHLVHVLIWYHVRKTVFFHSCKKKNTFFFFFPPPAPECFSLVLFLFSCGGLQVAVIALKMALTCFCTIDFMALSRSVYRHREWEARFGKHGVVVRGRSTLHWSPRWRHRA